MLCVALLLRLLDRTLMKVFVCTMSIEIRNTKLNRTCIRITCIIVFWSNNAMIIMTKKHINTNVIRQAQKKRIVTKSISYQFVFDRE